MKEKTLLLLVCLFVCLLNKRTLTTEQTNTATATAAILLLKQPETRVFLFRQQLFQQQPASQPASSCSVSSVQFSSVLFNSSQRGSSGFEFARKNTTIVRTLLFSFVGERVGKQSVSLCLSLECPGSFTLNKLKCSRQAFCRRRSKAFWALLSLLAVSHEYVSMG